MEKTGLHSGLELRLNASALRIAKLKSDLRQAKGLAKIERDSEIERLEQRHKLLDEQLHKLDLEGAGFRQNLKAEIEKATDDLTATLEDFVVRLDSQKSLD